MKVKLGKNPKKESPTPLLQKWHKNEIFKAIQTVGLDPRNFDLNDSGAEVRIKDRSSASCFIVRRESGYYVGGDGGLPLPRIVFWPFRRYARRGAKTSYFFFLPVADYAAECSLKPSGMTPSFA